MSDSAIADAIRKMAGTHNADRVFIANCEVENVDEASRSCNCTLIDGKSGNTINALLMPVIDDGMLLIPSKGSTVKVIFSDLVQPFICQYGRIDKILFIVGNSTMQVVDGTIQFNNGELGGLAKIVVLTQKLNNLENLVNELIGNYNAHTHILTLSSGTGTAAPTTTQETSVLAPTMQSEIEDTKITH